VTYGEVLHAHASVHWFEHLPLHWTSSSHRFTHLRSLQGDEGNAAQLGAEVGAATGVNDSHSSHPMQFTKLHFVLHGLGLFSHPARQIDPASVGIATGAEVGAATGAGVNDSHSSHPMQFTKLHFVLHGLGLFSHPLRQIDPASVGIATGTGVNDPQSSPYEYECGCAGVNEPQSSPYEYECEYDASPPICGARVGTGCGFAVGDW